MSVIESISIVVPALNEAASLPDALRRVRAVPEVKEIILVDGGSQDQTRNIAAAFGCRVLNSSASRGLQMRAGAQEANGDVVLFLHADTWLPPDAGEAALACLVESSVVGGGYWKVFRQTPRLLLGARWKCALRQWTNGAIYGDQALFVRRHTLEAIGGVPDIPLMEDVELCRRLRRKGRLVLANATVTTSARRFRENGVLRMYWRILWLNTLYRLGVPPERLKQIYERKRRAREK